MISNRSDVTAALALALAAAVLPVPAVADMFPSEWRIGGMVLVAPKYEGSKDYRVIGVPMVAPALGLGEAGRVSFKGTDDIRLKLLDGSGFELGPVVGWRFGREEDDADRLRGLGDVDGGFAAGAYGAFRHGGWSASIAYSHQVSGDETGGLLRLGLERRAELSPWLVLTGSVGATWTSEDYMDAFFSVTAAQALRSGLARYDADAGFKDVSVGLVADVALSDRWALKLSGRYAQLIGDAPDSPIVESEGQFYGGLGLTYRFSLER